MKGSEPVDVEVVEADLARPDHARALRLGCCKLTLEVREDNERARGLHASVGFGDPAPGADPVRTLFLQKRLEA